MLWQLRSMLFVQSHDCPTNRPALNKISHLLPAAGYIMRGSQSQSRSCTDMLPWSLGQDCVIERRADVGGKLGFQQENGIKYKDIFIFYGICGKYKELHL